MKFLKAIVAASAIGLGTCTPSNNTEIDNQTETQPDQIEQAADPTETTEFVGPTVESMCEAEAAKVRWELTDLWNSTNFHTSEIGYQPGRSGFKTKQACLQEYEIALSSEEAPTKPAVAPRALKVKL